MTKLVPADIRFFRSPDEFRAWLAEHHETAAQVWVGYHRKSAGRPSLTWEQSVDQALCFGWIDGIRKGLDDTTFTIRFTPRRRTSGWSAVNLRRVAELTAAGLMTPAGLRAHEGRDRRRDATYAYESQPVALAPEHEAAFRADAPAWAWFSDQPPGYRRTAVAWIAAAKQEPTRRRRLAALIEASAGRRRVGAVSPPGRTRPGSAGS